MTGDKIKFSMLMNEQTILRYELPDVVELRLGVIKKTIGFACNRLTIVYVNVSLEVSDIA